MTIVVPSDVADLFDSPEQVINAFRELKAMREARLRLVVPDGNTSAKNPTALLKPDGSGLSVLLPFQFKSAIADPSAATAAALYTWALAINAELRRSGINPS